VLNFTVCVSACGCVCVGDRQTGRGCSWRERTRVHSAGDSVILMTQREKEWEWEWEYACRGAHPFRVGVALSNEI